MSHDKSICAKSAGKQACGLSTFTPMRVLHQDLWVGKSSAVSDGSLRGAKRSRDFYTLETF